MKLKLVCKETNPDDLISSTSCRVFLDDKEITQNIKGISIIANANSFVETEIRFAQLEIESELEGCTQQIKTDEQIQ